MCTFQYLLIMHGTQTPMSIDANSPKANVPIQLCKKCTHANINENWHNSNFQIKSFFFRLNPAQMWFAEHCWTVDFAKTTLWSKCFDWVSFTLALAPFFDTEGLEVQLSTKNMYNNGSIITVRMPLAQQHSMKWRNWVHRQCHCTGTLYQLQLCIWTPITNWVAMHRENANLQPNTIRSWYFSAAASVSQLYKSWIALELQFKSEK